MYHHYTVDEHLIRCVGYLQEIERGGNENSPLANDLMRKIQPEHRAVLYVTRSCTTSPRAGPRITRSPAPRWRGGCARGSASAPPTPNCRLADRAASDMSTVAQSRDLSDRKTIENFAAVVQSLERLKLLTILTIADIRARRSRRLERLEGAAAAHAVLRDRAGADRRLLGSRTARSASRWRRREFRAASPNGRKSSSTPISARHYPAYWLKVDLPRKIRHARFLQASEAGRPQARDQCRLRRGARRHRTDDLRPTIRWLLSIIAGACAAAGANIVDAQIFTTTDGRALDTIAISREFDRDEDEGRRATGSAR